MKRTHIYVGGEWVRPMSADVVEVENPATEQIIGEVPAGSAADVDHAVRAEQDALRRWSALSPGQRAGYLDRIWQNLARRREDIARTITQELGTPIRVATSISVRAADNVKKVALELGGKSANVILCHRLPALVTP